MIDLETRDNVVVLRIRHGKANALDLELFLAQPGGKHDLLGDHCRLRHRHDHLAGARAALGDDALDRLGDLVELFDLSVGDPAFFEAFDAKTLDDVLAAGSLAQLDELHAG